MVRNHRLKIKFDFLQRFPREFLIKALLVILLTVVALLLILNNHDLIKQNTRMTKFINNREVFEQNLAGLQQSEMQFSPKVLPIKSGTDLEKLKADHIDHLLNLVKNSDLKMDSYRSEIENKEGFVILKYNLTIIGDFVQVLRFFALIFNEAPYAYISAYDIRLHQEKFTHLGLTIEILGMER